jgi:hypothetical protein
MISQAKARHCRAFSLRALRRDDIHSRETSRQLSCCYLDQACADAMTRTKAAGSALGPAWTVNCIHAGKINRDRLPWKHARRGLPCLAEHEKTRGFNHLSA